MPRRLIALHLLAAALLIAGANFAACGDEPAAAKTMSDCEYARTLDRTMRAFSAALGRLYDRDLEATSQETGRLFDQVDADTGRLIAELQGLNLDREMDRVNRLYLGALQEFRRRVPLMRAAATTGDTDETGNQLFEAGDALTSTTDTIARDLPQAARRLRRCR